MFQIKHNLLCTPKYLYTTNNKLQKINDNISTIVYICIKHIGIKNELF